MAEPQVVFVNRFYWPEQPATAQLLTDLAEGLACSGHSVTVLTRLPPGFAAASQRRNGVNIVRLPTSTLGRQNLLGRAFDFLSFIRGARRQLESVLHPGDILVSMTDPPLLGAALDAPARKRGAHRIHWVQDIFPEVAVAVSGNRLPAALSAWRNRAWRNAFACVAPGEDMAAFVRAQGVTAERVLVSENWAPRGVGPADGAAWRQRQGLSERFVVMYSGNLGRVHDFAALPGLAGALTDNPRIQFVFIGEGARKAELVRAVQSASLANVRFLPAQQRDDLATVLSAGDLHLVTLRSGCERLVFPSKLYGIAAVGRPALVLAPRDSEPARLVLQHGFGLAPSIDNPLAIAEEVRALAANPERRAQLGAAALAFAAARGGPDAAVSFWDQLLRRPPAAG